MNAQPVPKIALVADDRRCIVIGAGLLGLASAWALSRRGWAVAVLEAAPGVGHPRSGSKGTARIFRLGYPDSHYVEMAVRAQGLWRDLERATGRTLLRVTGQVSFGEDAELDAIEQAMAVENRVTERLPAADVMQRFPGLAATNGPALYEPDSGVLAADECLAALRDDGSFEVATECRVTSLEQRPHSVVMTTARGSVLAADVVVNCTGPLSLDLLPNRPRPAIEAGPSIPQVA
jgi:sarcosine oxidase